jgi:hypothetical protein
MTPTPLNSHPWSPETCPLNRGNPTATPAGDRSGNDGTGLAANDSIGERLRQDYCLFPISNQCDSQLMSFPVPILLIIWRRPQTTRRVIDAIRQVKPSSIYIACDGPRPLVEGESEKVQLTRALALQLIDWDCQVSTRFSDVNLGCRDGVSSAISWFFQHVAEGIILEDDVLPYPEFFEYCQSSLKRYRRDDRIWAVSANCTRKESAILDNYPESPLHLRYNFSCWGWATWRDRWACYNAEIDQNWLSIHQQTVQSFCGQNSGREVLRRALLGGSKMIDTWDYQVNAIAASRLQLTLHPRISLVENIGFGPDATHTSTVLPSDYFNNADSFQRQKWLHAAKSFLKASNAMPTYIREVSDLAYLYPPLWRRAARLVQRAVDSFRRLTFYCFRKVGPLGVDR